MTTDQRLDAAPPRFSWVAPTDPEIAAILADPLCDGPPVLADDCGCIAPYGLVVPTLCGLYLCGDCAATHRCPPCDADARDGGED